jgi:hypothetical protein
MGHVESLPGAAALFDAMMGPSVGAACDADSKTDPRANARAWRAELTAKRCDARAIHNLSHDAVYGTFFDLTSQPLSVQ